MSENSNKFYNHAVFYIVITIGLLILWTGAVFKKGADIIEEAYVIQMFDKNMVVIDSKGSLKLTDSSGINVSIFNSVDKQQVAASICRTHNTK